MYNQITLIFSHMIMVKARHVLIKSHTDVLKPRGMF